VSDTTTTRRDLDPDALAALEEERRFLLRSLDDLEREHEAGDVDDVDYETLKDDYTARAARTIRSIESHHARLAESRPGRSWRRLLVTVAAVATFALLAGVVVAQASGRRGAGDTITGNTRQTTRTQLDQALQLASQQNYDEAIALYDEVLAGQPENVEAMTYKGWIQFQSGDGQGVVTLINAAGIDPSYPATHAFLAVAFERLGRPETAQQELDRLDALDPPPEFRELTASLRQRLPAEIASAGSTTTTTAPPAP
jgi:tetratricopeptide (TPR) repeat protein